MAEEQDQSEKTEDPTQKKLEDALKRGDVVKSQEVNTFFVLAATAAILMGIAGSTAGDLSATLKGLFANAHQIPLEGAGMRAFVWRLGGEVFLAIAAPLAVLAGAALIGNLVQHRFVWSAEQMKPKLSKIDPISGFGRIFGKVALVNFAKGLFKLALVGTAVFVVIWPHRSYLDLSVSVDPLGLLGEVQWLSLKIVGVVLALMLFIAAADYAYQYYEWYTRQRMSVRDVKEEYKQSEGDPHIKAKLKQIRQQRMKKRMMAEVPKASVVITNPTHYAVALKYEDGMGAPLCVAKGVDALALKIREIAGKHDVPIVENPPLARALHATVDIEEEVPQEHWKAVAEVIGYVMRLRRNK